MHEYAARNQVRLKGRELLRGVEGKHNQRNGLSLTITKRQPTIAPDQLEVTITTIERSVAEQIGVPLSATGSIARCAFDEQ
jgi:hypothetical protein